MASSINAGWAKKDARLGTMREMERVKRRIGTAANGSHLDRYSQRFASKSKGWVGIDAFVVMDGGNVCTETRCLKATRYFRSDVQAIKRPEITDAMCEFVMANPYKIEEQADGRFRFFRSVPELGGRIVRVVTLDDGETVHNAFPDRRAKP